MIMIRASPWYVLSYLSFIVGIAIGHGKNMLLKIFIFMAVYKNKHRQNSDIRRTESQTRNVSRLVLQLSLLNQMKPPV